MLLKESIVTAKKITLFSPSKLNLFFRILGKRVDGYHEIGSLYQAISLGDTLTVRLSDCDTLSCSDSQIPTDQNNLIFKAADLFRRKTKLPAYAHYTLQKNIPVGAGLGGGSGNAASALFALNTLFDHPATLQELMEWSGEIGSDISFFFSSGTAYCHGRGELVEDVDFDFDLPLYLAIPAFQSLTGNVYRHVDLSKTSDLDPLDLLSRFLRGEFQFINDLEYPAFQLNPELANLKKRLLTLGFTHVCMTGSGSAFFCSSSNPVPRLEGVAFHPIHFIRRKHTQWYSH